MGLAAVLGLIAIAASSAAAGLDGRIAYIATTRDKAVDRFAGSVRFHAEPTADLLGALAALGVEFHPHHSRTVRPAHIPLAALDVLAADPRVASIECAWRPAVAPPPLARVGPALGVDRVWAMESPAGGTVTGKGVLVADLDTGVDLFHANFFALSDEIYAWLDVDGSGDLSAGDAVDLDGDGLADPDEDLRHAEAIGTTRFGNTLGIYDVGLDYLFNDAHENGVRDYGPPGYGEDDPCYGERVFLCDDLDADGLLDPGEPLLALGGSRIRAALGRDGHVYRRGVDLLEFEGDWYEYGHGTLVTGVLAGGYAGYQRTSGMAPGAEVLHVVIDYIEEPPFELNMLAGLAWAVEEGADIVLIEDGAWIWEYLDGSSHFEIMMNELAADEGVIFVVPAGNLATGHMHSRFPGRGGQGLSVAEGATVSWISFLWTAPVALGLTITTPAGAALPLPLDGTAREVSGYEVYSNLSTSERGTRRLDLRLASASEESGIDGDWSFAFTGSPAEIHGYFFDDVSGWVSPSSWRTGEDDFSTVTWPATADSAIVVAAHYTYLEEEIAPWSGRGPRIDGAAVVDLAAPCSVVSSTKPDNTHGFESFNGTSCSAPFVAGAAALMKELQPDLDHALCRRILRASARVDPQTADPRLSGAGKLDIEGAVALLLGSLNEIPRPVATVAPYPNPFNGGTTIRFRQFAPGTARVRVFDASGREVWDAAVPHGDEGWREIHWGGVDREGRRVPSGVYFAHVGQDHGSGVGKVTVVR